MESKMNDNSKENKIEFNRKKLDDIIKSRMGYAMVAGAIPIPLLDIAAVTTIQLDMLSRLGQKYDISFNKERGKIFLSSIVSASLGSILGRLGASAVKIIPGVGTALGISTQVILAGASTFAVGVIFEKYFREGKDISELEVDQEYIKSEFSKLVDEGKEYIKEYDFSLTKDPKKSIAQLIEMRDEGLISQEEYEKAKADILKKM